MFVDHLLLSKISDMEDVLDINDTFLGKACIHAVIHLYMALECQEVCDCTGRLPW